MRWPSDRERGSRDQPRACIREATFCGTEPRWTDPLEGAGVEMTNRLHEEEESCKP